MKKFTSIIIVITIMCLTFSNVSASNENITVILDGTKLEFDVQPIIVNGRTLVPMRAIFEALGAQVQWYDAIQCVNATSRGTKLRIYIGSSTIERNGCDVEIDVPAMIVNDRTLVPIRVVSECLGVKVDWIDLTQTIILTTQNTIGKIEIEEDLFYEGELDNTIPNGYGIIFEIPSGEIHRMGLFSNGELQQGIINFDNGDKYKGDIKNDMPNGKGTLTFSDGDYIEGTFIDGKANGYCFLDSGEDYTYEGELKDNVIEGSGILKWSDGSYFDGNFSRGGIWNGSGKYYNSNTYTLWIGSWSNGKRDGWFNIYDYTENTIATVQYVNDEAIISTYSVSPMY